MAYAVYTDIQSEFKGITFGASGTSVIQSEVTEFIAEEEAVINQMISKRYDTPVTNATSILILKKIVIAFVSYRVANILYIKREVPLPSDEMSQKLNYGASYRNAEKLLNKIIDGKVPLHSDDLIAGATGISSYNVDNDILPTFERDTDQW